MFNTKPHKCILNTISASESCFFDIPIICPNCNFSLQPIIKESRLLSYGNKSLLIISFIGNCCSTPFYATYIQADKSNFKLLDIFPHLKPTILPENIINLSSRFSELYYQSYTAEQNNHLELAGSGYRNSIEILIKDFAIKKLNASEKEVCKMSLYDVIGKYLNEVNIEPVAADVIRVLGNDYTHYERKYNDIDFIVVKKYLEIFINQIETRLLLIEPIVPTNRQ